MFINLSNHPSSRWSAEQLAAAKAFGDVEDMTFPVIPPESDGGAVVQMADRYAAMLTARCVSPNDVVHVMGEMTFTYALVRRLRGVGIRCLAATTSRIKTMQSDGTFISEFKFQSFRPYE